MKSRAETPLDPLDPLAPIPGHWGPPIDPAKTPAGHDARRRQLVEAGEVDALLADVDRPWGVPSSYNADFWADVAEALRVASRRDPAGFALQQIDEMIALLALIRVRTERSFRQRLAAGDRAITSQGHGPDPAIEDPILEKLLDLFERTTRLIEARAAIERRTDLTRRSKNAGPDPAGTPEGKGGRRKGSDDR